MEFIAGIVLGIVIGLTIFFCRKPTVILRIDHKNPEKDIYRLEFDDLDKLDKKKRVVLKIDNNADLSHH